MKYVNILLLAGLPWALSGQTFNQLFDHENLWQGFGAAVELEDGHILLSGANAGNLWKHFFIWNVTLDPNGDTLYWQRITSGDSAIYYIGRQALVKNGPAYYLAGTYEDYNNGVRDACRLKMNYQGARIWEKEFGGAKTDILDCLQRTRMAI